VPISIQNNVARRD